MDGGPLYNLHNFPPRTILIERIALQTTNYMTQDEQCYLLPVSEFCGTAVGGHEGGRVPLQANHAPHRQHCRCGMVGLEVSAAMAVGPFITQSQPFELTLSERRTPGGSTKGNEKN